MHHETYLKFLVLQRIHRIGTNCAFEMTTINTYCSEVAQGYWMYTFQAELRYPVYYSYPKFHIPSRNMKTLALAKIHWIFFFFFPNSFQSGGIPGQLWEHEEKYSKLWGKYPYDAKMPICDKVAILIVGFHELVKTENMKHL